jgi:hypothetical protein
LKKLEFVSILLSLLEHQYENFQIVDKVMKILFSISLMQKHLLATDIVNIIIKLLSLSRKILNHPFPIMNFFMAILYNFCDNKDYINEMISHDGFQLIIDVFEIVYAEPKRFSPKNTTMSLDSALAVINLVGMIQKSILTPNVPSSCSEPSLAQILENILQLLKMMAESLPENRYSEFVSEGSSFIKVMFTVMERYLNIHPLDQIQKRLEEVVILLYKLRINPKNDQFRDLIKKAKKIYKKSEIFKK